MVEKKSGISGKIHSFETLGATDGPGLRFVLFMQGCNLRCKYCHNPDSWRENGYSKTITAKEMVSEVVKYKNYFGKRGGFTVSGGEPLLQLDFLLELFSELKKHNVSVALDTSGAEYNETDERYAELLPLLDLVILDVKHIDNEKCKKLTGRGNANMLAFAKRLSNSGVPMIIRQVLVPNLTDDENDLKKTREWINSLKTVVKTEVLPYHTLGKHKYEQLGIAYPLETTRVPTYEEILRAERILAD